MTKSYDKNQQHFIPFESLKEQRKDEIASLVHTEVDRLFNDLKYVKKKTSLPKSSSFTKMSKLFESVFEKEDTIPQELNHCINTGIVYMTKSIFETDHPCICTASISV